MLATKVSVDCKIPIDNVKSRFIEMFGNPVSNSICWPTKKMIDVAPSVQFSQEPMHDSNWLLNLDAIQSNSGEILFKNIVSRDKLTGSIMCFGMGNVLYSKLRPYLNKVVVPNEPGFGTTELIPLLPNPELLNQTYFACLLRSDPFVNNISLAVAGTKMPRVSMGTFWKFDVPLPPIDLQNEFATFVKQVDKSKAICKQIFQSFDNLVKSRFIEMFGDESIFKQQKLGDLVEEMFIGPFGSSLKNECFVDQSDGFCIVYEQKHAIQKTLNIETRFVTKDKYLELQRFNVHPGDIIVSCRGTIGETFIIPENAPLGIMHPSIMKIRLKPGIYNTLVFNNMLKHRFNTYIDSLNGSSVKMAITAKDLGKQMFPIPDIHVQNQFADFVEQVDKSKFSDGMICSR